MNIIELAREAGFNEAETEILKQEISSFAALVRAEVLEEAAGECEHTALRMGSEWMAGHCAIAIRALKEKKS